MLEESKVYPAVLTACNHQPVFLNERYLRYSGTFLSLEHRIPPSGFESSFAAWFPVGFTSVNKKDPVSPMKVWEEA